MKKIICLLLLVIIHQHFFAQHIGIGTNSPNASAILDVSSSNKGILLPRVFLQTSADNTTVASPSPNLIVFNTNPSITGGTGLFYNSNSAASPTWAKVGDIKTPYYNATSSGSTAFTIENYAAGATANGIKGFSQNSYGVTGSSGYGTGVLAYSLAGTALEINGKLEIKGNGQTPGLGKVLTSDASGNATWEGAIAFSSTGIQPGGASEFSDGVEKRVPFYTEDYDYGNNYNPSSGAPYSTFTAPVKGIYHFDIQIAWQNEYESFHGGTVYLKSTYNGVTKYLAKSTQEFVVHWAENAISRDVQLEAGTQVFVTADQNVGSTQTLFPYDAATYHGNSSFFNGRLVMRL